MTNEEIYISSKMGRRNPFMVPDGYFDQLTQSVMEKLPEQQPQKVALVRRLRPLLYAAACMCAVILSATIYINRPDEEPKLISSAAETTSMDTYLDEAADYAMVDNHDIYACLIGDY